MDAQRLQLVAVLFALAATAAAADRQPPLMTEALPSPRQDPPPLPRMQPEVERTPPVEEVPQAPAAPLAEIDVLVAVLTHFPLLLAIEQERGIAGGELTSAWGGFDTLLGGSAISQPLSYYKNYRYDLGVEQPLWSGSKVFGGYKLGRGEIEPWFFERKTNEGGEFRAGFGAPLLRDRPIDKRRVAVLQAEIQRRIAEPAIRKQQLLYTKDAAGVYWSWVAAGRRYQVVRGLLKIAEDRQAAVDRGVQAGAIAAINSTENQRLIAGRRAALISAERKFQEAAIRLSLYYRDARGLPVLPPAVRLPERLPPLDPPNLAYVNPDIALALEQRPEVAALRLYRERTEIELAEARNQLQPGVDAVLYASQDVGYRADPENNKGPFELQAGVMVDVPLQRRAAAGKVRSSQAKIAQLAAELRFAEDSVTAEVRDALSAWFNAQEQLRQIRENVRLNQRLQELEVRSFQEGLSNLFLVNLREQTTAEAETLLVDAEAEVFKARAAYRAAVGVTVGEVPPVR